MRAKVALAVAFGLSTISFSCASTGSAGDSSFNATVTLRDSYKKLLTDVESTVKALDEIEAKKDTDLQGAYASFATATNALESQTATVKSAEDRLRAETATYIKKWEERLALIQNETIRKSSAQLRDAAAKRFDSAKTELNRMGTEYESFRSDLKDIKNVLDTTRNSATVKSLSGPIASVKKKAGGVKKDITAIVDALEKLSAAMETSKAPPEEPKTEPKTEPKK